jgi:hypothetical protein
LFDRPKPTVGCSASGRRGRRRKEKKMFFANVISLLQLQPLHQRMYYLNTFTEFYNTSLLILRILYLMALLLFPLQKFASPPSYYF